MKKILVVIIFFAVAHSFATAAEKASCKMVRLADIGWTDVTSTTAVAAELLHILGYQPEISVVSMPVTFASLKNNDLDVFLGNWMPTQEADIRPYLSDGSIIALKQNLEGAVYTLAVPDYVYEEGVKSFADLAAFGKRFAYEIYGIEPGNDGNRLILRMINDNAFGLKDFKLIESSEQAMLTQVKDAVNRKDFVVFLAWAPHPMNMSIKLKYLAGGDTYFGPDFGASKVFTVTRREFANDCPNLNKFFEQLVFTVEAENQIMSMILHDQLSPKNAAHQWLFANAAAAKTWIDGVTTITGERGVKAFERVMVPARRSEHSMKAHKAPVGQWMEQGLLICNGSNLI